MDNIKRRKRKPLTKEQKKHARTAARVLKVTKLFLDIQYGTSICVKAHNMKLVVYFRSALDESQLVQNFLIDGVPIHRTTVGTDWLFHFIAEYGYSTSTE